MSYKGQLGNDDILKEYENKNLILNPFDERCLKGASYDLTPSVIAMSSKVGMLEKVYREKEYREDRYFVYAHAKDTVLIVSNEYIRMPDNIAGYISSRVSKLVEGFGHISTTIDPEWAGAVLIAVSNPTSKPLKVYVGKSVLPDRRPNSLATVTLHYLNTPLWDDEDDEDSSDRRGNGEIEHRGMRIDLLEAVSYKRRRGLRAVVRKCIHLKRRRFTDYFFSVSEGIDRNFTDDRWNEFVEEFSYINPRPRPGQENMSRRARQTVRDFVVTESILTRFGYFIRKHSTVFWILLGSILYILLCFQNKTDSENLWDVLKKSIEFILPFLA